MACGCACGTREERAPGTHAVARKMGPMCFQGPEVLLLCRCEDVRGNEMMVCSVPSPLPDILPLLLIPLVLHGRPWFPWNALSFRRPDSLIAVDRLLNDSVRL